MQRSLGKAEGLAWVPTSVNSELCSLGNPSLWTQGGCFNRSFIKGLSLVWMQAWVGGLGWRWLLRIHVGRELQTFHFSSYICPGTGSVFPSFLLSSPIISLHLSMPWVQDGSPQKRSSEFCLLGPPRRRSRNDTKKEYYCFIASLPPPAPPSFLSILLKIRPALWCWPFVSFSFFGPAFVKVSTNLMSQEAGRWPFRPSAWMWQCYNKYWMVRAMEI